MEEKDEEGRIDPKPTKTNETFFQTISMEMGLDLKVRTVSLLLFIHLESLYKFPWQEKSQTKMVMVKPKK